MVDDEKLTHCYRFVEEGWLTLKDDPNGRGGRHTSKRVSLGVRAMMDLKRFVLETWPADELCCVWYFPPHPSSLQLAISAYSCSVLEMCA